MVGNLSFEKKKMRGSQFVNKVCIRNNAKEIHCLYIPTHYFIAVLRFMCYCFSRFVLENKILHFYSNEAYTQYISTLYIVGNVLRLK